MKIKKIFLAADSGGSKTEWVVIDDSGTTITQIKTKGLAAIKEGILPVKEIVSEAYEQIKAYGNIESVYLSLGGPNVNEVENALKNLWNHSNIKVEREANGNAMLNAAKMLGCNAVVMCGTGSVAIGDTKVGRKFCGGWGPTYADGGSGGGLCTDALKIFLRSLDGLEQNSSLNRIFSDITKGLNLNVFEDRMEAKKRAVELDRRTLASFAPQIYKAAVNGDHFALKVYENAAKEIANMAFSVSDNTENDNVLLCGGFLSNSPLLLNMAEKFFSQKSKANITYNQRFSPIVAAKVAVLQKENIKISKTLFEKLLNN